LEELEALSEGDGLTDEQVNVLEEQIKEAGGPSFEIPVDLGNLVVGQAIDVIEELLDRLEEELEHLDDALRDDLTRYANQTYQPAIDGRGNADCQNGQNGWPDRLITTSRYPPSDDPEKNGGSHVIMDANSPWLAGPTYTGVQRLQDVDDEQRSRHPKGEVPENRPQRPNARGVVPPEPDPSGAGR
jgi:hypothetical protein